MPHSPKHFWLFFFQRHALLVALTLSALAHVTAYVATHDLALPWHASVSDADISGGVALSAVLVAADTDALQNGVGASKLASSKPSASKPSAPKSAIKASQRVVKNATPQPAKSAAPFAAPENAMAVDANAGIGVPEIAHTEPQPTTDTTAAATLPQDVKEQKTEIAPATVLVAPVSNATAAANSDTAATSEPAFSFPQRISMAYRLSSSVADGIADFSFRRSGVDGRDYELTSTIQATGIFAGLFVGAFRQTSRGEMTYNGIRPAFFSMQRGDAPTDTAEFNRDKRELKIIKHGETHLFPLPPRLQDTQSFLFQLAQEARQLGTSEDSIKVALTNARKLFRYEFRRVNDETLQTRMGALTTIHLKSDATDPEDVYEVWLSPKHFYLPVKIKFYMGKFLVEQTVSSITASEN